MIALWVALNMHLPQIYLNLHRIPTQYNWIASSRIERPDRYVVKVGGVTPHGRRDGDKIMAKIDEDVN